MPTKEAIHISLDKKWHLGKISSVYLLISVNNECQKFYIF